MKSFIKPEELLMIDRSYSDAIKGLGALEAKDRPHVGNLLLKMKNDWIFMVRQSRTTVNLKLADERGLSNEKVIKIAELQKYRERHIRQMKTEKLYSDNTVGQLVQNQRLANHLAWLKDIEYELQSLWGFDLDSSFHEYNLPHCTCPQHRKGEYYRMVNANCPIHNSQMKLLVSEEFDKIDHHFDIDKIEK